MIDNIFNINDEEVAILIAENCSNAGIDLGDPRIDEFCHWFMETIAQGLIASMLHRRIIQIKDITDKGEFLFELTEHYKQKYPEIDLEFQNSSMWKDISNILKNKDW